MMLAGRTDIMPDRLKRCTVCGLEKPARHPEFDRNYASADLLSGRCAGCRREMNRGNYARNRETIRAKQRQYHRDHPDIGLKATQRWREKNPERAIQLLRSSALVQRAIQRGQLVRPLACSVCGAGGKIEAAVGDHTRPVETVRWLCRPCMRQWTPEQRAAWAALIARGV
jgi:hypothetical protein